MLPRIVLFGLQIVVAWYCADWIVVPLVRTLGVGREYVLFLYAAVFALIVWLVGLAGGGVLKAVSAPSGGTFVTALVLALAAAAAVVFFGSSIDAIIPQLSGVRNTVYPLAGAMIGYLLKR